MVLAPSHGCPTRPRDLHASYVPDVSELQSNSELISLPKFAPWLLLIHMNCSVQGETNSGEGKELYGQDSHGLVVATAQSHKHTSHLSQPTPFWKDPCRGKQSH